MDGRPPMDADMGAFADRAAEVAAQDLHPVNETTTGAVPVTADRWHNRRRMAWRAFYAGVTFPFLILLTESEQLGALAGAFYMFISAVVGAYIGFATLDDRWQKTPGDNNAEPL